MARANWLAARVGAAPRVGGHQVVTAGSATCPRHTLSDEGLVDYLVHPRGIPRGCTEIGAVLFAVSASVFCMKQDSYLCTINMEPFIICEGWKHSQLNKIG